MKKQNYAEVYSRLMYETAGVVFLKKNGEIRFMLCTRNIRTVEIIYGYLGDKLCGHDKRCGIGNGNVAVIDLYIGDARSFNIDRVLDITYFGELTTKEQLDTAAEQFSEFEANYKAATRDTFDFDALD